jgi:hypothetical protein
VQTNPCTTRGFSQNGSDPRDATSLVRHREREQPRLGLQRPYFDHGQTQTRPWHARPHTPRRRLSSAMTWLETLPPLGIIVVAISAMGYLPSAIHRGFHGKVRRAAPSMPSLLPPALRNGSYRQHPSPRIHPSLSRPRTRESSATTSRCSWSAATIASTQRAPLLPPLPPTPPQHPPRPRPPPTSPTPSRTVAAILRAPQPASWIILAGKWRCVQHVRAVAATHLNRAQRLEFRPAVLPSSIFLDPRAAHKCRRLERRPRKEWILAPALVHCTTALRPSANAR